MKTTKKSQMEIIDYEGLEKLVHRLNSERARKTSTFVLVGAGAAQSSTLAPSLRLPLASSLRNQLLIAHYGTQNIDECLESFKHESGFVNPSPDQVWQFLIRNPERMQSYAKQLHHEFSATKPIPASYHMLARWFFSTDRLVGGIATTNFDLQFARAFENVARSSNRKNSIDFDIAELPQDFRYFADCDKDRARVIQRLHGSLDRPWSIVAGAKENVYDISHLLIEHVRSETSNPFNLLIKLIEAVNPDPAEKRGGSFPPYEYLRNAIKKSGALIVIGYSFQDEELVSTLSDACGSGKEIYIIDPNHPADLAIRSPFLKDATLVKVEAEAFLDRFVRIASNSERLIQLPSAERNLLRDGPNQVPGYPKRRLCTTTSIAEPNDFEDPIYGTFRFSPDVESDILRIVDTGEIQRLRQIKQLSFVNLKFHGATHDRFTHSLGVAHLADKLMHFWRNAGMHAAPRKLERGDHLAFVAGSLIHDIGHGPFGHTMDLVRQKLNDNGRHEDDTARIFEQIFTANSFADLDKALNEMEIAKTKVMSILGYGVEKPEIDILHSILDNSGCDIDRLDFVLRDSHATLLSLCGEGSPEWENKREVRNHLTTLTKNYEMLLKSLSLRKDGYSVRVFFEERARPAMTAFAFLYLLLYRKVYYCWQNVCAQSMLAEAVTDMVRSRKIEFEDIKPLTDVELLAVLEEFENPKVAELAYLVKHRRLYRLVNDVEIAESDSDLFRNGDDKTLVERVAGLAWNKYMLVARLPAKKVRASFISLGESNAQDELISKNYGDVEELGSNPPRLFVFEPPN